MGFLATRSFIAMLASLSYLPMPRFAFLATIEIHEGMPVLLRASG